MNFQVAFTAMILITTTHGNNTHWISSPLITDWGNWGHVENCPRGSFVTGMQLKVEHEHGWKDDTGLNGVRFFCSKLGKAAIANKNEVPKVITSSVGPYGEWKNVFSCSDLNSNLAVVVGFQMKTEIPKFQKGLIDDTSANNLRLFCLDLSEESGKQHLVLEGDGTKWGQWSESQICKPGYAICGLLTQVDHGRNDKNHDDTALNNIRAECCVIRIHSGDSIESEELDANMMIPDPVESAKQWEKEILRVKIEEDLSNLSPRNPTPEDFSNMQENIETEFDKVLSSFTSQSPNHEVDENISNMNGENIPTTNNFDLLENNNTPIPNVDTDKLLSEELHRLLSLNLSHPEISSVAIATNESPPSSGNGNISEVRTLESIEPILPPHVVKYLESDIKDDDPDPQPIHIKVIKGSIIKTTESPIIVDNRTSTVSVSLQSQLGFSTNNMLSSSSMTYTASAVMIFQTICNIMILRLL